MALNTSKVVTEDSTAVYEATLTDEDKVQIPKSLMNTLVLTLHDIKSGSIINSRNGQNVFDLNNVTIATDGKITWIIQAVDNIIVATVDLPAFEVHKALFELTWNSSTRKFNWTVDISVKNLAKVP